MIEFAHTAQEVDVSPLEYQRLLGYPRDFVLEERALELVASSRAWYAEHGRPWVYARLAESLDLADGAVCIDGEPFVSERLHETLHQADAESVILVAASAGPELERQSQLLWEEEKPDEFFFLDVYGSAVVEHLLTMKGAELCAWAETRDEAILPHYSPGYPEWDVAQQPQLLSLIGRDGRQRLPGFLEAMDSGMLRPKKSLLAVFGVTRQRDRVARLTDLSPCEGCSYLPCQYRRAPFVRATRPLDREVEQTKQVLSQLLPEVHNPVPSPHYSVHPKALARWAANRLELTTCRNGTIYAKFRYEGTTCSNLGRRILCDYHITLGPREEGYTISSLSCTPAPSDEGYTSMCSYLEDAARLQESIDREQPLLGEPLRRVLDWDPPQSTAGCYCERSDRLRKWQLVFETIHFALVEREQRAHQLTSLSMESK
jgi:hypothetical protein